MPRMFDNNSYEQWVADGEKDVTARALATARTLLDSYVKPPLDPAIDEALLDYIARRETNIPAVDALNQDA
jgi:trimethylamine--corrinoid protein Co-methyltransferase